jgi:cell division protein FtsW
VSATATGQRSASQPSDKRPQRPQRPSASAAAHLQLDRPLTSYYLLLASAGTLLVLGLVMVFSASSVKSYASQGSSFAVVRQQAIAFAIGLPLLWAASRMKPSMFRALAYVGLAATIALLCLVPVAGVEVNGNRNWLRFGPMQLQPSEFAKLAVVIWGADLLARKQKLLHQWKHLLVPLLPVGFLVIALVLLGNDLGTALVLIAVVGALLFFAGAPIRLFVLMGAMVAALVTALSLTAAGSHRLRRFDSWLNPGESLDNYGWQLQESKYALGSGNWYGVGLGGSREKWGRLPEQHTDFIFAIIGEELGLLGTVGVLCLFALLGYAGFRIAARASEPFVRYAAAGITAWILFQAVINVGSVIGLLPIMGLPLPLISYGGSALLSTMLALGVLLAFARREPGAAEAFAARPSALRRAAAHLPSRPAKPASGVASARGRKPAAS